MFAKLCANNYRYSTFRVICPLVIGYHHSNDVIQVGQVWDQNSETSTVKIFFVGTASSNLA